MPKILLLLLWIIVIQPLPAQNLVVNPDAESLPRGTGWTIISKGAAACTFAPTDNFLNWTLIPDGSSNYPFDNTIKAAGGTVFFPGCSDFLGGPFELQQTIDVSADATDIDAGTANYVFEGFIQTPVSPQTDQGRFIVDCLSATNAVLGASYMSAWQSNSNGSGTAWVRYPKTIIAPVGTRKVRIRLLAQLYLNRYAVNVHFDDISLTKLVVLPVKLISFTGKQSGNQIELNWEVADEINITNYVLEQSITGANFTTVTTINSGKLKYSFIDKNLSNQSDKKIYRLKIVDADGKFAYSNILTVKSRGGKPAFTLSPNPAKNFVTISGLERHGILSIHTGNGESIYNINVGTQPTKIDISKIPAGIYIVRFNDGENVSFKKLVIQPD